jgi:pyruvate/2-oxoglutarate dehydrogenase complex dihydrolipoamide acyltransferase (E2) component
VTASHEQSDLFRLEAVHHHVREHQRPGDVLRISPAWTRWTFWVLVGLLVAGLIFCAVARIPEYAEGPAVIWVEDRLEVPARTAGTVQSVEVNLGARVQPGDLLMRLYDAEESAELERIERAFELQLINSLRDPLDEEAHGAMTSLRAQREQAEARLQECRICAPEQGVISDIHVREGQPVAPGDVLVSLRRRHAQPKVVALLPARYLPELHAGMPLRLELTGYRYYYQELIIESVGDGAVGPQAAWRYLGQQIADAVPVQGPVVVVQATLPSDTFTADHREHVYFHGMQGTAAARVRSESVLRTLVPWLKRLDHDD